VAAGLVAVVVVPGLLVALVVVVAAHRRHPLRSGSGPAPVPPAQEESRGFRPGSLTTATPRTFASRHSRRPLDLSSTPSRACA
jgi:hypothetical protein